MSTPAQVQSVTEELLKSEGFGLNKRMTTGRLKQRFTFPPFSIWDTRQGDWQKRRRLWLERGILSECGRSKSLTYTDSAYRKTAFDFIAQHGDKGVSPAELTKLMKEFEAHGTLNMDQKGHKGHVAYDDEHLRKLIGMKRLSGTSIFDPVICELAYSWWCPPGGTVLDPFAGGSVRGIICSLLDRKYLGIELREEQVVANRQQLNERTVGAFEPKWRQGDSYDLCPLAPMVDMVFSCPPYGNLETYSDIPEDISNMEDERFKERYAEIIKRACSRLQEDRFAVWVVSNFRDKKTGEMKNFVGDTIGFFQDAGLKFYNDVVLVNAIGTGAMRANTNMLRGARKLVKVHQNVLTFVKGDSRRAGDHCPVVEAEPGE